MKSIELYINGKLCDTGNPDDFSVYLKRQLLNPSELSSKDTQRSYDITLPASPTNNDILKHVNVEEVKSKFTNIYDAILIIGGVKVFEGKFKLNEITRDQYRGNLGTPVQTVKDIFGEKNMNETGKWEVEFHDGDDITRYNKMENPDFFFPLVMYGLLPKEYSSSYIDPEGKKIKLYSGKRVFDENVLLGIEDVPASLNCLTMLRRIFENQGVRLSGSAFADERLSKLYVSYKNPDNYDMPWNYGDLAKMQINGVWSNAWQQWDDSKQKLGSAPSIYETGLIVKEHPVTVDLPALTFSKNILNSTTARKCYPLQEEPSKRNSDEYKGYNYTGNYIKETPQEDGSYLYSIRIPHPGYYKVELDASLFIPASRGEPHKPFQESAMSSYLDIKLGGAYDYDLSGADEGGWTQKYLNASRYEIKLLRSRGDNGFKLDTGMDGTYFRDNYKQDWSFHKISNGQTHIKSTSNSLYDYNQNLFPPLDDDNIGNINKIKEEGTQILFVDPVQNPDLVVGLNWGRLRDHGDHHKDNNGRTRWQQHIRENWVFFEDEESIDKLEKTSLWATVLAAKSIFNEDDKEHDDNKRSRVIINNPQGYWKVSKNYEDTTKNPKPEKVDNFRINLLDNMIDKNYCKSYARRREFNGKIANSTEISPKLPPKQCASGSVKAIVWFDSNEMLTLATCSDYGLNRHSWVWHMLEFDLKITPYRVDKSYGSLDPYTGKALTEAFYWDEMPDDEYAFRSGNIDLIKFLPSNVKVDDWISNFCKAFNLELIQVDTDSFELNIKHGVNSDTSLVIDLDQKANVKVDRKNVPLGLPGTFKIGFTCDKDEYGYYSSTLRIKENGEPERNPFDDSIKQFPPEDGGGTFKTGSVETNTVDHKSNFSYNWMIDMKVTNKDNKEEKILPLPVISDKEVWKTDNKDYEEMMLKSYTDKAQRFWYKDNETTHPITLNKVWDVEAGLVTNALKGSNPMVLDYKDMPDSIMRNYFTVLADADNCFTTVECYLSPEEYAMVDRALIRFNGDMYHAAEVDGFDPLGKKKATLKLIRKMF